MENVFGLAYKNQSARAFNRLAASIRHLGYSLSCEVLNAADYGVPQNRQRLFIIGARDGRELNHPAPTHWGEHERRARPVVADRLLPHVTAGDALRGLRTDPEPSEVVNGEFGRLLEEIPPGGNYLHFTKERGHASPIFKWRSRYWTFLLKLDPKRPASTIQGQPGPYVGPFHWESRRLRVPELKRLQGFPDNFEFAGTRSQIQLQVGNSVPPLLAFVVASFIRAQLEGEAAPGQLSLTL
jgi:DNA (cytosine-5)-methyltransferase 1